MKLISHAHFTLALVATCLLGLMLPIAQADLKIVTDGQPQAQIVISDSPARKTKLAAGELQKFVKLISGAELPITTTPAANVPVTIYLGQSDHVAKLNLKLRDHGYQNGAFHIASGDGWIAMVGDEKDFQPIEPYGKFRGKSESDRAHAEWEKIIGEPMANPFYGLHASYYDTVDVWLFDGAGPLNAVYELLRQQGVRWYMEGEIGQVVPTSKNISFPSLNKDFIPDFTLRNFSFFHDHLGVTEDEAFWRLRIGLQGTRETIGLTQPAHGSKFVHMLPAMREKYPEMFAIWGGQRNTHHKNIGVPCLSSEIFFEKHVQFIRGILDHYKEVALNIDVVDGYAYLCECDRCQGKGTPQRTWAGSMSDYVWGYLNRVAQEVYKTHPDRMLVGLSYSSYMLPPEKIDQMSPNLGLIICQTRSNFNNEREWVRFAELRKDWQKKLPSGKIYTWDYYMHNWAPQRPYAHIPVYFNQTIQRDIRSLQGVVQGEMLEVYDHNVPERFTWHAQAVNHLALYLTSRLWWDSKLEVDDMLAEYYEQFYGPAKSEMKAFIEYSEENWRAMRNDAAMIDKVFELLAAATKAAGEDNIYRRRIDLINEYVKPMVQLRERLAKGRDDSLGVRSVVRNANEFELDGKLDEPIWQKVRRFPFHDLKTGQAVRDKTTVYFAWVGDSLYLGLRCEDADASSLPREKIGNDDPNIFKLDNIDILLETQTHAYYQLTFSPAGDLLDMDRDGGLRTGWNSNATIKTHIGDGFWSAEVRLPAAGADQGELNADFGIAGYTPSSTYPWYINILRQSVQADGTMEHSALSPTGGKFHDPQKFAKVYNK